MKKMNKKGFFVGSNVFGIESFSQVIFENVATRIVEINNALLIALSENLDLRKLGIEAIDIEADQFAQTHTRV